MRPAFVAGAGQTRFGKRRACTLKDLVREAVTVALNDAGIGVEDVQSAYCAAAIAGSITGQEMIVGQVTLRPLGITSIPIINVENACASGSTAFHLAWQAVAAGACDIALAVGAEKMSHPDPAQTAAALRGGLDVEDLPEEDSPRPLLMAYYAGQARDYMAASDATVEDFASVAVKNQRHGSLNELAQYGGDVEVEEVLAGREIVWPLTLLMCSPISDGAAAAVLMSESASEGNRRRVRVAASVVASAGNGGPDEARGAGAAAARAYDLAGIGPGEVDVVELHDAVAPAEIMLYEELGLAAKGRGPAFLREGTSGLGGRVPVNPSGGLLARGHPIAATGLAQIAEAVHQLRGEAGARQVPRARVALTHNGGGVVDQQHAATVIHILGPGT